MSAKQFFKSTSFKCIIALLCVLLVSGLFLTVAYGFLEVTEGERLQRAVKNIYGVSVNVYGKDGKEITANDTDPEGIIAQPVAIGNAEIQQAYKITFADNDDVNYLVQATGKGGYSGGTVTCWVAVKVDDTSVTGVGKITIAANNGQSFISKITDGFLNSFSEDYEDGIYYSTGDGYLSAGASLSSNAICNAVNGSISFVKAEIFGENVVNYRYTEYIDITKTTFDAETRKFTVATTGLNPKFELEIVVAGDKTIESFTIIKNGSTSQNYIDNMNASIKDGSLFVGKDLSYFTGIAGEDMGYGNASSSSDLQTGATESNFSCFYACAFALANYDTFMGGNE